MASRAYVVDIAGGTATATVQIQGTQTFKSFYVTALNAAAGKIELSLSSTSQIGTAQPDSNVIARVSLGSAAAGNASICCDVPINLPVKAFQSVYVHCTGAGNLGTAVLR
jgi:hypothetical protein